MPPLFTGDTATDPIFIALRDLDGSYAPEARAYVEQLWSVSEEYLDADAASQARVHFLGVFWEMYLAATLVDFDLPVRRRAEKRFPSKGPDFQLGDVDLWVEAATISAGVGPQAVPQPVPGQASSVPDAGIKLRLLSGLDAKRQKHADYVKQRVVGEDEPFVVALSAAAIPSQMLEIDVPRVVRALFGRGHQEVYIDRETMDVTGSGYSHQPTLQKQSGAEVSADLFCDGQAAEISAVLYGSPDPFNHAPRLGADLIAVHNPFAACPLEVGLLPVREEWQRDGDVVRPLPGIAVGE